MHRRGYNATGVADIVDAVSAPKGSFYAQFESKQAFACEVVDAWTRDVLATAATALTAGRTQKALPRLRGYFKARARRHEAVGCKRGCIFGNMSLEIVDHDKVIREHVAAGYEALIKMLADCIAEGQRAGDVRHDRRPRQLATLLLSSWEGALVTMRIAQDIAPVNDFISILLPDLLAPRN